MEQNIKSGFSCTGLFPFNADNVNYSKVILRKTSDVENNSLNISPQLELIERNIDKEPLKQFHETKNNNSKWTGPKSRVDYLIFGIK